MWIAGLDALHKPLLHLHTQLNAALPWATIDMDFMNLNQAAHGDREFGYIADPAGGRPQDGRRPRVRPGAGGSGSTAGSVPPPGATTRDGLRLARFGDNMRDVAVTEGDKVEAELRFGISGQHLRGSTNWSRGWTPCPTPRWTRWWRSYADSYEGWRPSWLGGGARHASLRYAARIEAGLREFLVDGGFGAFTDLALAAHVEEPTSGRAVTVFTDQPGVQFYSGNFLNGAGQARRRLPGVRQGDAFCLEPQQFPNAPNEPGFPSTVFRPGECYRSRIVLRFARN